MGTIYQAINLINNKSYIGKTTSNFEKYKQNHVKAALNGVNKYFYKAIRKHGKENFKWKILFQDYCHPNKLNSLEIFFIAYYNTFSKNGYNLTLGGDDGWRSHGSLFQSEMGKRGNAKMKFLRETDPNWVAAWKKNVSTAGKLAHAEGRNTGWTGQEFKGRHHTEESKLKISKLNSIRQRGKNNSQYGKMWIYNPKLKVSKRIDKNDDISEGWYKGRKIKF